MPRYQYFRDPRNPSRTVGRGENIQINGNLRNRTISTDSAYSSVNRRIGTNRMRISSRRSTRGQRGLKNLRNMSRFARNHHYDAFPGQRNGRDYSMTVWRDAVRKRASTGHSGG